MSLNKLENGMKITDDNNYKPPFDFVNPKDTLGLKMIYLPNRLLRISDINFLNKLVGVYYHNSNDMGFVLCQNAKEWSSEQGMYPIPDLDFVGFPQSQKDNLSS